MRATVRILCAGEAALCAAFAFSTTADTAPTVTGTVTQVEEYTLYVGSPPAAYTLTTTTSMGDALVDDSFPENLQGQNVSITYQTVDGQNLILTLQALPDQP